MNIGIDATCWWNNRGFGRFTRDLLTAMFQLDSNHHFFLFVDQPLHELSAFGNVTVVQVASSRPTTEAAVADSRRSVFDLYELYRAVANTRLDLMYFPAVYSWFPVPRKLPSMVTIHDAIAEHYPKLIFPKWKHRMFWALKVKLALWQSQRILTISQAAKEEIVEYMGADPDVIDVASAAPNPQFRRTDDQQLISAARQRALLPADARMRAFTSTRSMPTRSPMRLSKCWRTMRRAHLAENALERARTFTWSRAARLTLRHLEGMLRPDES
ncbi:MAG: glycosyltransferase [Haliea sp.]|nr:glycosyltransferase [Haliea sp.]